MILIPDTCRECGQPKPLPERATVGCVIVPTHFSAEWPIARVVTAVRNEPQDLVYAVLVDGRCRDSGLFARSDTVRVVRWATADEASALLIPIPRKGEPPPSEAFPGGPDYVFVAACGHEPGPAARRFRPGQQIPVCPSCGVPWKRVV